MTTHELRHTFVAMWADAGVPLHEISRRAGHSSTSFTFDRYGHIYEDVDDRISDQLDALLEGAGGLHSAQIAPLRRTKADDIEGDPGSSEAV